jgi:hypothetical protein
VVNIGVFTQFSIGVTNGVLFGQEDEQDLLGAWVLKKSLLLFQIVRLDRYLAHFFENLDQIIDAEAALGAE